MIRDHVKTSYQMLTLSYERALEFTEALPKDVCFDIRIDKDADWCIVVEFKTHIYDFVVDIDYSDYGFSIKNKISREFSYPDDTMNSLESVMKQLEPYLRQ